MSGHNSLQDNFEGFPMRDPGASGTIACDRSPGICHLDSLAAESRTLAVPTRAGAIMTLAMRTDGGDITLTVTSGFNEDGETTFTFSDPGQFVVFQSVEAAAGTFRWRKIADYLTGNISAAVLAILDGITATAAEINRAADVDTRIVPVTASSLAVTVADHDGKIIELDRAAGIAVTLPSLATSLGAKFEFWVKTTFTGAASIKSVAGTDIMVGHAQMGNDSDNTTVLFQALAANTFDTIDLFGTANSTGGIQGQRVTIIGGTGRWYVEIVGDAAGTEATPFQDTVA